MNYRVNPADKRAGVIGYCQRVMVCPVTGKQTNLLFRSAVTGRAVVAYDQDAADRAHEPNEPQPPKEQ